jgi:hypothetical protein
MKKFFIWTLLVLFFFGILYGIYWLIKNWKNIFYGPEGSSKNNPVVPGTMTETPEGITYNGVSVAVLDATNLGYFGAVLKYSAPPANGQTPPLLYWGQYVDVNGLSTFMPFSNQAAVSSYILSNDGMTISQVAAK